MYGAYEIGTAGQKAFGQPRTITKAQYERNVRQKAIEIARKRAHAAAKHAISTPADYAAAKIQIDAWMKRANVTVSGDYLVGVSDIMGAAFVMGAAERGNPQARRAVAKVIRKARAGSPQARKQVRAMVAVERGKRRRPLGLFARYTRAVTSR